MSLFIVFEGIDGTGKGTQIARLCHRLEFQGYDVTATREPTDSPYGRRLREIGRTGREGVTAEEEAELYVLDREIDVRDTIRPALDRGGIVISDRYYFSNIAYQGALGLSPDWIRTQNQGFPEPDLVFLLDLDPKIALERIERGREEGTNEGYEQFDYLTRVRENYLAMHDRPIVRIDAAQSESEVFQDIWERVEESLSRVRAH